MRPNRRALALAAAFVAGTAVAAAWQRRPSRPAVPTPTASLEAVEPAHADEREAATAQALETPTANVRARTSFMRIWALPMVFITLFAFSGTWAMLQKSQPGLFAKPQ